MVDTTNLSLPLIGAAQAQKHVTVNEALVRLDGLAQLRVLSRSQTVPPAATDGETYGVPVGALNDWAGYDGQLAIFSNGGWIFAQPQLGWHCYIDDEASPAMHDGTNWVTGAVSASPSGAVSRFEAIEINHPVVAGATSPTTSLIPANSIVFGVTGRVTQGITGTATSFELGVAGATNRYGSGLGLSVGSYVHGLTGTPTAYYSDTALQLTATGGAFDGAGSVTLVVHVFKMTVPV